MNFFSLNALVVVAVSGSAFGAVDPVGLEPSVGEVRHAGHIYFNVATGEKITTLIEVGDTQNPATGIEGTEIWVADTGAQCADFGYSTEHFFDLNADSSCSGLSCDWNVMLLDWGEISMDTVVDCVQVHWITDHPDTDMDSDSIADGVEGFAATWTYWDAVSSAPIEVVEEVALPIIDFSFFSLPGVYPAVEDELALWTADIDLGGSFGTSLVFEIGDTDSDLQGAEVHNARFDLRDVDSDGAPDNDYNENGLAEWGWSVFFVEPGTADVDNLDSDSDWSTGIDGVYRFDSVSGIRIASPTPGHAEYDSVDNRWDWVGDGPTAGMTDDAAIFGVPMNPDGTGDFHAFNQFSFGGLNCSPDQPFGYRPAAHFAVVLYGPFDPGQGDCPPDIGGGPGGTPDGHVNFLDISQFLTWYSAGDLRADIAGRPDGGPDGRLNFFDISRFIVLVQNGCEIF
tara:strand:- start:5207 stop:6568 length:1362 start_codon:yes stop_codon:yes gene_type:complete